MNLLTITNLKKTYSGAEVAALDAVNLTVESGEFFGLLGPNGSGKTTMISILCGIIASDDGDVQICSYDHVTQSEKIKPLIGLVPQSIALYSSLTLKENLNYFAALYGLSGRVRRERIDECLQMVGLEKFVNKQIATFSGGMKRRANLAVGVLHKPKFLLLDEPTVGVDPQSRNMIFENLQKMNQEGMTIFYTTHYLEEAEKLCSNLAILDGGHIIKQGSPQALIAQYTDCDNLGDVFLLLTGHELRD